MHMPKASVGNLSTLCCRSLKAVGDVPAEAAVTASSRLLTVSLCRTGSTVLGCSISLHLLHSAVMTPVSKEYTHPARQHVQTMLVP
jgi:hypothetical protein